MCRPFLLFSWIVVIGTIGVRAVDVTTQNDEEDVEPTVIPTIEAVLEKPEDGPIVSTTYGDVLGEEIYFSEDNYLNYSGYFNHFKGIPYAAPPVGDLRFRPPETVAPWPGVYDATYFRDGCPEKMRSTAEGSEDCLYLNVLVPSNNLTGVPVMVWIHAGQYSFGSSSDAYYWAIPLLAASGGDVIFVSMNFRMGVFGFMTTGDDVSPGNYGLYDQRMALTWVKENIEAFGGDPEQVTLFGTTTGSGSVSAHLLSNPNCDLFKRAILQSGTAFDTSAMIERNISRAIDANKQVASILGCETDEPEYMVKCMRNASVNDILEATEEVEERLACLTMTIAFYPVVDGEFIPDNPENIIKRGEFKKADIILGVNENEGTFWLRRTFEQDELFNEEPPFLNVTDYQAILRQVYQNQNMLYSDSIQQQYTDWDDADDPEYNYLEEWTRVIGDQLFQCPTDVTARAFAEAGNNVYRYVNEHFPSHSAINFEPLPEWRGVSHLEEMPLVFGWYFNPEFDTPFNQTEEEILLSIKVMRYWTNFAKTGNPNTDVVNGTYVTDPWPAFTVPGLEYNVFSTEVETDRAVRAKQCSFWANHLPRVAMFTDDLPELEEDWRNSYYDWKYVALDEWQTVFDEYKAVTEPCT